MSPRETLNDRMRRFAAGVIVVLYAVLATIGPALVICEDSRGHVAIEWRGADCCAGDAAPTPSDPAHPGVAAVSRSTDDDCGECNDESAAGLLTSRSANATRCANVPSPADVPASVAPEATRATWVVRAADAAATPRAGPVPPPPLAQLRTVVLRC